MNRLTVSLTPELHERLRAIAKRRRASLAALIREALEKSCRDYEFLIMPDMKRPKPHMGVFDSGHTDKARKIDELLAVPEWRSS